MRRFFHLPLLAILLFPIPAYADHAPDGEYTVVRVVDGDTIVVQGVDSQTFTVRYIGIDTPETVHPRRGVECYGPEASAYNRELVLGVTVWLERDVSDTDRYGRLVRHVWLGDRLVSELLLESGHARAYPYRPDISRAEAFAAVEGDAWGTALGIWGSCGVPTTPSDLDDDAARPPLEAQAPSVTEPAPSVPAPSGRPLGARTGRPVLYDPFGPDRDCGDFPTWAEAQDFYEAAGGPALSAAERRSKDRHGLDTDYDGIACETRPGAPARARY